MEMDKEYERKCFELAYLIFPDVNETVDDLEIRYPARNLKEGAKVVSLCAKVEEDLSEMSEEDRQRLLSMSKKLDLTIYS